ncbi:MAG: hypothetical protein JWQ25_503 [Daejeonella sp.]|nr:hypothetical protein [Daejeonella sp.]
MLNKHFLAYFDVAYFSKFIVLLTALYCFHILFNGLVSPEGTYYSSFLDHHLNYISWLRLSLINSSNFVLHTIGIQTYLESPQIIKLTNGAGVNIWFPCLGLGITSFWIAFVTAHTHIWLQKLYWCAIGIVSISIINCARITLLLISLSKSSDSFFSSNHHDLFNLGSYILIFFLALSYSKIDQPSHKAS